MEMAVAQRGLPVGTLRQVISAGGMDPNTLVSEHRGTTTIDVTSLSDADLELLYSTIYSTPAPTYHNCNWVQCDSCSKWRRLPVCAVVAQDRGWECSMHPNGTTTCEASEDTMEADN